MVGVTEVMIILFRSCGGLGNQLFQLLFVRLLAKQYGATAVYHYHEHKYDRVAFWEYPNAKDLTKAGLLHRLLLKLRIPQLAFRLKLRQHEYLRFGNVLLVDGYFQRLPDYTIFDPALIQKELEKIRLEMAIGTSPKKGNLLHVRLGDYFKGRTAELEQLQQILDSPLGRHADLITNRDKLILELLSSNPDFFTPYNINYITTKDQNAVSLVQFASSYQKIISNGSTLTFWSAILGSAQLVFDVDSITNSQLQQNCVKLQELKTFLTPSSTTV